MSKHIDVQWRSVLSKNVEVSPQNALITLAVMTLDANILPTFLEFVQSIPINDSYHPFYLYIYIELKYRPVQVIETLQSMQDLSCISIKELINRKK